VTRLERAAEKIRKQGPDRVVINSEGEACGPEIAQDEYGVEYSVVYLRNDGWTLGVSPGLRSVAFDMYADSWIAVMEHAPNGEFEKI
jgi:hypothetical protein